MPLVYHVAMKVTIFNWAYIVANNLSWCIASTQGGLAQINLEFYMGSYLVDCIVCLHQFPKLNCTWNYSKTPIYVAYQIQWVHKYSIFYKLIYEELLMPLYDIIFLKEFNFMFEEEMDMVCEYGDYYFSKEGTYLGMYGES